MSFEPGALAADALGRFGDVQVGISVELGRTQLSLAEVLALQAGSVVALNRLTDELLDVTANGKPIARAEVVAQDGRFALRIVELVGDGGHAAPVAWPPANTAATPDLATEPTAEPATANPPSPTSAPPPEPNGDAP
jgi:flagellar motor switch protein FliN/FliY